MDSTRRENASPSPTTFARSKLATPLTPRGAEVVLAEKSRLSHMGKSKGGGDAFGGSPAVPSVSLEQFADALVRGASGSGGGGARSNGKGFDRGKSDRGSNEPSATASGSNVSVFRWDRDPRVYLLHFASAAAQRDAMGRASIFLEDLESHGALVDRVPSGQRGGVANYSGHNMRLGDLCRFLNLAKARECGLNDAESGLAARLLGAGAIRTDAASGAFAVGLGGSGHRQSNPKNGGEWRGGGPVIAAVAGSSDAGETRDAVLHEAMHMVFYGDDAFAQSCRAFWETEVDADEKRTWIDFLRDLRYDVTNEELVVNELQAYMCTERRMFGNGGSFGGDAAVAGSRSSGGDRRKKNSGGAASGGTVDALAALQRRFASAAREWLPAPPSVGEKCKVVWR